MLFEHGLKSLSIRISPQGKENILLFCRELQKWNKKINLIARNTPADVVIEKHFLDSLTLLQIIVKAESQPVSLLDVGTGAGFPGLVLAAVMPALKVTLVEPRLKRITFLRHIVRTLGLVNVQIVGKRLEQAGLKTGQFSFITSRAVADIDRFLPMVESLCTADTRVIVMRSSKTQQQSHENREARWQVVKTFSCKLPVSGAPRLLTVVVRKF